MSIDSSHRSGQSSSRNGASNGDANVGAAAELKSTDRGAYPSHPSKRLLGYDEVLAAGAYPRSARDSTRRKLLVAADIASLAAALAVTGVGEHLAHPWYRLVAAVALWVLLNKILGLYDWDSTVIDKWTFNELPRLAQSVAFAAATLFILGPPVGLNVHRYVALEFGVLTLAAMWASRSLVRLAVLRLFGPERALIIGSGEAAELIGRKLRTHPSYGTEAIGYIDGGGTNGDAPHGSSPVGDLGSMHKLCRELRVERLIIAFSGVEYEDILDAIRAGKTLGVKISVTPRLFEVLGPSVVVDGVQGMSVLSLRSHSRTRWSLALKRTIDIVGAAAGLVLFAPVLALIAVLIKLDSRGPVIFSQVRIGRGNRPFRIHKFRTMVVNADELKDAILPLNEVPFPLLKIPEDRDPRLTRVGRVLRRTMLDELPQLWNVLRGEMSLVGPRPLEPQDDAEVMGWHRTRLELTPGLTGPWQALGRHVIPFREMLTLDYLYAAEWSLWHDVKLLVRTVQALLRSR
jgi:exopolysaccharide biosynthesis polyprenyl glycosylphosphotransferase